MSRAIFILRIEFSPDPPVVEVELHSYYGVTAADAHAGIVAIFEQMGDAAVIVDAAGEEWPMALGSLRAFATRP